MTAEDAVGPVLYRSCRHPRFSSSAGVHKSWEGGEDPEAVLPSGRAARDDMME